MTGFGLLSGQLEMESVLPIALALACALLGRDLFKAMRLPFNIRLGKRQYVEKALRALNGSFGKAFWQKLTRSDHNNY